MSTLKYKVISSKAQYTRYANTLEELVFSDKKDRNTKDEIALLTLLIENWDSERNSFNNLDPVGLLHSLMTEHSMKAIELSEILGISKGYVSDILHYKKGLSKDVIRKLAGHFKISQEVFNRPYKLKVGNALVHSRRSRTRRKKSKTGIHI